MKKLMNGNLVDTTPDEISAKQAEVQTLIDVQNKEKAIADTEANASSGKQKLKDLGLNDAEIKALIGV